MEAFLVCVGPVPGAEGDARQESVTEGVTQLAQAPEIPADYPLVRLHLEAEDPAVVEFHDVYLREPAGPGPERLAP